MMQAARRAIRWSLHFSQEEAAHMLGASRQSVNRVLKRWEAALASCACYRAR
ncbi:MAG: winged helix-turn-helix domain-containing protein [Sphingomonadales bacterium]|nr:winged helix-turn-helix domain-containing protein [Sphingomonadales bacterium]